jgi:hypothetical protein
MLVELVVNAPSVILLCYLRMSGDPRASRPREDMVHVFAMAMLEQTQLTQQI